MVAARHLEFSKFAVLVMSHVSDVILLYRSKFRVNRTIQLWDVAEKLSSIWRVSALLDLSELIVLHPGTLFYVRNIVLNFPVYWFSNFDIFGLSCFSILVWNYLFGEIWTFCS